MITMAVTSNLYVNAFLTHELYTLLKNSNKRKKHSPPTITKVAMHAILSYGLGIIIFCVPFLGNAMGHAQSNSQSIAYFIFYTIYVAGIPLSVVVWISYQIFRHELLRSTESMYEGRLRILVVYFARIVLSDLLFWIPAVTLYYVSYATTGPTKILTFNTSLLFMAFQSIVVFACSVVKPDVRKLITDLVCGLVYCRRGSFGDSDASRRCSSTRLSCVTDPYLWRLAAPGQESVLPMSEAVAFEGTRVSSQENSRDDNNDDSKSVGFDREDDDAEA